MGREDRTGFWDEVPKSAKLLKELSWLGASGATTRVQDGKGEMVVENQFQWDAYGGYLETRFTIQMADQAGRKFSYQTGFYGLTGLEWAQELGSLGGVKTLMLVGQFDPVFPDGRRWAEWIEREEGGFFLEEERFQALRWRDPKELSGKYGPEQSTVTFTVPPSFMTFLDVPNNDSFDPGDDPFAPDDSADAATAKGRRTSVRRFLEENGIVFREDDFVSYLRGSNTLIAKLSPDNLELLDGIVNARIGLGSPEYPYAELTKVEGDDFDQGRVLKRMVLPLQVGADAKMTLGEDSAVQVELLMDPSWLGEVDMTFSDSDQGLERPDFRGRFAVRYGRPILFRSETISGIKTSWFMTVRNKVLEKEVDALLKKREE